MFGTRLRKRTSSAGFIRLYGLSVRTAAERDRRAAGRLLEAAD
jgi:hypothetical protein